MALITATQIIPDVSFITAHVSYSKTELLFIRGGRASCVNKRVGALTQCCFHILVSIQVFRGALTASVDSCGETECFSSGVTYFLAELAGRCRKAMPGVWCRLTLRAPLSGTFLQTLPDLVTLLKGHSLSPRSCPPTRSAPPERFGY